ncbi:uncharacterized protein LOC125034729 isoform X1 [Penaeus chinensis]|uniref:uncharacterized protein LOC125034729 isoform X1 n=1 Tax=Penaeus chinensis TaxID=139456 RepID=UPI001FB59890|nr:uncharacterized protein LOC125034729 isoform X1 [Penaeus chinensis]
MGIHWSSVEPDENFAEVMIPKIRRAGFSKVRQTPPPYPTAGDLATDFPETSHASWILTHFHSLGPTGEHASPCQRQEPIHPLLWMHLTHTLGHPSPWRRRALPGYTFGEKLLGEKMLNDVERISEIKHSIKPWFRHHLLRPRPPPRPAAHSPSFKQR